MHSAFAVLIVRETKAKAAQVPLVVYMAGAWLALVQPRSKQSMSSFCLGVRHSAFTVLLCAGLLDWVAWPCLALATTTLSFCDVHCAGCCSHTSYWHCWHWGPDHSGFNQLPQSRCKRSGEDRAPCACFVRSLPIQVIWFSVSILT